MAKYNNKISYKPNATSYEGGAAYTKNCVEDWLNFLFSSYLEDRFYEKGATQTSRFIELTEDMIDAYGVEFVAKASVFARNEIGMRSVSQLVAAILNDYQFDGKRRYFRNFCRRPDDIAEIFGAIDLIGGKRSHALVRGCGDYLSACSPYTIGKYKLAGHEYNLYDLINITHATSDAIDAYKNGTLETPDTWETNISTAKDQVERDYHWRRLVQEKKLGYLALLRNLRNILNAEGVDRAWIVKYLVPEIINENAIHKSLVLPYQIYSAYKNIDIHNSRVEDALNEAFYTALDNMPILRGDTAILLDVSGSMGSPISARSNISIREAGAVYAACIFLTSKDSTFIKFGSYALERSFNKNENVFNIITKMQANEGCGYGTEIAPAYDLLKKKYDRIFLISDMQIMDNTSWYSGKTYYQEYCKQFGRTPIYSFDLGNYRTQTDNPNNPDVHLCTTLSEKTLKFISLLEDGDQLVDYINSFSY